MNILKTTIENLIFPCEIKNKIKIKGSFGNLDIKYMEFGIRLTEKEYNLLLNFMKIIVFI